MHHADCQCSGCNYVRTIAVRCAYPNPQCPCTRCKARNSKGAGLSALSIDELAEAIWPTEESAPPHGIRAYGMVTATPHADFVAKVNDLIGKASASYPECEVGVQFSSTISHVSILEYHALVTVSGPGI